MKKRLVLVALIALCLVAPVFAADNYSGVAKKNSVGLGLNLGTNTGVGFRYGMGDFDILANIGLHHTTFTQSTVERTFSSLSQLVQVLRLDLDLVIISVLTSLY